MSAAATGEVGVCSGSAEASAVPAHEGRGLDEGLGEGGAEQARSRQHPDEWRRGGIIIWMENFKKNERFQCILYEILELVMQDFCKGMGMTTFSNI